MGRNTEIYMFDKEKASTVLYQNLRHNTFFEKFLNDKNNEEGDAHERNFEQIIHTIKHDINTITTDNLFEIMDYYNFNTDDLKKYGIELLYQLPTSTVCYSYMFQYGVYTDFFPIKNLTNEDFGMNITANDFLEFNEYMILMMKRLMEDQIYIDEYDVEEFSEKELTMIRDIRFKNANNAMLFKTIDDELEYLKSEWFKDNDRCPYQNTIHRAYEFFKMSIEMNEKINPEYNTRIVIVDSY